MAPAIYVKSGSNVCIEPQTIRYGHFIGRETSAKEVEFDDEKLIIYIYFMFVSRKVWQLAMSLPKSKQ